MAGDDDKPTATVGWLSPQAFAVFVVASFGTWYVFSEDMRRGLLVSDTLPRAVPAVADLPREDLPPLASVRPDQASLGHVAGGSVGVAPGSWKLNLSVGTFQELTLHHMDSSRLAQCEPCS